MIKNILIGLIIFIGVVSLFISKKVKYKTNYLLKTFSCAMFYTSVYLFFSKYLSGNSIKNNLDSFVSISATLTGCIFTGLSIVLSLIGYDYIKSLFKNDFIDILFYTGYSSTILSIVNIILYVIIRQFCLYNRKILIINQYILGLSLILLIVMFIDFIFLIKQLKNNLNRK